MNFNKTVIDNYYLSTVCHVCKEPSPNFKRCSKCKLLAYCSQEHQRIHWKSHKEFCKMIETYLNERNPPLKHIWDGNYYTLDFPTWLKFRENQRRIFEDRLDRGLTNIEIQIWMSPRICEICRLADQSVLKDCERCYSASYCCTDHQERHSEIHDKFCLELRRCYETNKRLYYDLEYPKVEVTATKNDVFPENITEYISKFTKLHIYPEEQEIKDEIFRKKYNVDALTDKIYLKPHGLYKKTYFPDKINHILASSNLSQALTVLYSLFQCSIVDKFNKDVTIHLIGASDYERYSDWSLFSEVIFKHTTIPNLNISLIGPEIPCINDFQFKHNNVQVNLHLSYYDEFCITDHFSTPDIIIAFNSGFHELFNNIDTWEPTNKVILQNINFGLFIFTSYTEKEAFADFERVKPFLDSNLAVVLKCQKNPFASLRPIRDFNTENIPIFYSNNYLSVIKNNKYF